MSIHNGYSAPLFDRLIPPPDEDGAGTGSLTRTAEAEPVTGSNPAAPNPTTFHVPTAGEAVNPSPAVELAPTTDLDSNSDGPEPEAGTASVKPPTGPGNVPGATRAAVPTPAVDSADHAGSSATELAHADTVLLSASTVLRAASDVRLLDAETFSALPDSDLGRIHAETLRPDQGSAAAVANYHGQLVEVAQAAIKGQIEATCKAAEAHEAFLKANVALLTRFVKSLPSHLHTPWTRLGSLAYHGITASTMIALSCAALFLDVYNLRTVLHNCGPGDLATNELATICCSIGAAMLTLALKAAASSLIGNPTTRVGALLVPAVFLLGTWVLLTAYAFPGFALDSAAQIAAVTSLSGTGASGMGIPASIAWVLTASATLGLSFSASGLYCYGESLFLSAYHRGKRINPDHVKACADLIAAQEQLKIQSAWVGRLRGEIKGLEAQKAAFIDKAVAVYEMLRRQAAPRPPTRPIPGRWFAA